MPYIETRDGTNLYYKDWGTGRPVVLLHGWPLSSDSWDDIALPIAQAGMRAIAYDRRGFGRSDQPWSGYDYETLADDLADVLGAVGAKDAALVGFSMGGGEVARYMSRHGGANVSQAALVASVIPYMLKTEDNPDGTPQSVFDEMAKGMTEDRAHFFAGFFKSFYGTTFLQGAGLRSGVSAEVVEWSRDTAMKASLKATLDCAKAFATTDFRGDLASFKLPTLIIHGTGDETVPIDAAGRAAARGIVGSTLLEYEGSPHGLFASDKTRLAEDLLTFLESHRP